MAKKQDTPNVLIIRNTGKFDVALNGGIVLKAEKETTVDLDKIHEKDRDRMFRSLCRLLSNYSSMLKLVSPASLVIPPEKQSEHCPVGAVRILSKDLRKSDPKPRTSMLPGFPVCEIYNA